MNLTKVTEVIGRERAGRDDIHAYAWSRRDAGTDVSLCFAKLDDDGDPIWPRGGVKEYHYYVTDDEVERWYQAHPDVCRTCHGRRWIVASVTRTGQHRATCPDCMDVTA